MKVALLSLQFKVGCDPGSVVPQLLRTARGAVHSTLFVSEGRYQAL